MDDETWLNRWRELSFILDLQYKRQKNAMSEALADVLNQAFNNDE